MKLISMTDFVLGQRLKYAESFKSKVYAYANFLKQPLTLGMFVPCDEDGNVLEEPLNYKEWCKKALNTPYDLDLSKYYQYQQAKERVLVKGFNDFTYEHIETIRELYLDENATIEGMIKDGITLTPYALKQIVK